MPEVEKLLRPTALLLGYALIFFNNLIMAGAVPIALGNASLIILGNYAASYFLIGSDAYTNKKATELLTNAIAIAEKRGVDTTLAQATLGDIQEVTTVIKSVPSTALPQTDEGKDLEAVAVGSSGGVAMG